MKDRFEEFYSIVPELLNNLKPDAQPLWGKMQILEMIEHLTVGFELSLTFEEYEIRTPKDQLPGYQRFLMSDKPFGESAKMPKEYKSYPKPTNQSLKKAKGRFLEKLYLLKVETETNANYWFNHPIFGKLNAEQTRQLHNKHIRHHFTQFGALERNG